MKCMISDAINSCDSSSLGYSKSNMMRIFKKDFLDLNYPRYQLSNEFEGGRASNDYDM